MKVIDEARVVHQVLEFGPEGTGTTACNELFRQIPEGDDPLLRDFAPMTSRGAGRKKLTCLECIAATPPGWSW